MARTREEAREVIKNIDARLAELTGPDFKGNFSADPDVANFQKIMLYYRLSIGSIENKKGEARAKYIADKMEAITSGEDEFGQFIFNIEADRRDSVIEELAMGEKTSLEFFHAKNLQDPKQDIDFAEDYFSGIFAPKTDRTKLGFVYDNHYCESLERVQDEIDAITLPVPAGMTDRSVMLTTLGEFLADDLQTKCYMESMSIKGSTLIDSIEYASGGVTIFFENMVGKREESRENMQLGRNFVPEARKRAATSLEAFSNGDRKPVADALMRTFEKCLDMCRYTADMKEARFRIASQLAVETYETLSAPEYRNMVSFTPEQKRWMQALEYDIKLNEEYNSLKRSVWNKIEQNYGRPGKPADDAELMNSVTRMLEIEYHRASVDNQTTQWKSAITSNMIINTNDADRIISSRGLYRIEEYALDAPETYGEYVHDKIKDNAWLGKISKINSWADLSMHIGSDTGVIADEPTRVIGSRENYNVVGKLQIALDYLPEKYETLRSRINGLSCMKGKKFPDDPTEAQLKERLDEYKKFESFITENRYDRLIATVPSKDDPEDEITMDVGSRIITPVRNAIKDIEDVIKALPVERDLTFKAEIESFVRKLGENFGKDGKTNMLFSSDGRELTAQDVTGVLRNGGEFRLDTYRNDMFVGVGQTIKFDPKTMKVVNAAERPVSRTADLSAPVTSVSAQLQKLRQVQEIIHRSDPFYVSNSSEFNTASKALDSVIEAQEKLGSNPNIRQIGTLLDMYDDLGKKVGAYVAKKERGLKVGDDRGKLRLDAFRTLDTIINKQYAAEMANAVYPEHAEMSRQSKAVAPTVRIMRASAAMNDPEEFCKAFDTVLEFAKQQEASELDSRFAKMGMAADFEKMLNTRIELAKAGKAPELSSYDQSFAVSFEKSCTAEAARFAGMDPTVTAPAQPAAGNPAIRPDDPAIEALQGADAAGLSV